MCVQKISAKLIEMVASSEVPNAEVHYVLQMATDHTRTTNTGWGENKVGRSYFFFGGRTGFPSADPAIVGFTDANRFKKAYIYT